MICRVSDLQRRDVICLKDGARLGAVGDVELDTGTARLSAVLVYGRPRFFGLIGRPQPVRVAWEDISLLGADTIVVKTAPAPQRRREGAVTRFFSSLFTD